MSEPQPSTSAEPRRVIHRRHWGAPPRFLASAMHRFLFGWWLESFDWNRTATGWEIELVWQRRSRFIYVVKDEKGTVQKIAMYPRMSVLDMAWLAWFYLTSRKVSAP